MAPGFALALKFGGVAGGKGEAVGVQALSPAFRPCSPQQEIAPAASQQKVSDYRHTVLCGQALA